MALTFPLSLAALADLMPVKSCAASLKRNEEIAGQGSGQTLTAELAPPLWSASVELAAMPHSEAGRVLAILEALNGAAERFYFSPPGWQYPAADPGGVLLGASAVTISSVGGDNRSLALAGLPAGYVLSAGDFLQFEVGGARVLLRLAEAATANGSGVTPLFEVRPHLRAGTVAGLAVTLKKPAGAFFIVPGSLRPGTAYHGHVDGVGFDLLERPA